VPGNYVLVGEEAGELERALTAQPFLKLSARCGLDRWEEAPAVLGELFRVLVGVLMGFSRTGADDTAPAG